MALPQISEFTAWADESGWHARWSTPLSDQEMPDLPRQVDANTFEQLRAECAWQRIRRDLATPSGWRSAESETSFCTGDLAP